MVEKKKIMVVARTLAPGSRGEAQFFFTFTPRNTLYTLSPDFFATSACDGASINKYYVVIWYR